MIKPKPQNQPPQFLKKRKKEKKGVPGKGLTLARIKDNNLTPLICRTNNYKKNKPTPPKKIWKKQKGGGKGPPPKKKKTPTMWFTNFPNPGREKIKLSSPEENPQMWAFFSRESSHHPPNVF
ncbi:hypothetical protein PFLG_01125 [Plasmodium falciparum RAJ116]|uniref:Uncharacterized protein n=1 Tax=Plasmodium falciparum RAJ116 TaxID=580058 RepID=A0A0L0CUJ0_PLAFA|nr:hypothetical protein PFLG_01125 [Plasmodium falciparum RAJ116]